MGVALIDWFLLFFIIRLYLIIRREDSEINIFIQKLKPI